MSFVAGTPAGSGLTADAGWYPDPLGHFPHRYWDGIRWTQRAAWNGAVYDDPAPSGPAPAEIDHLEYLQAYLEGAITRGVVRRRDVSGLLEEVRSWELLPHLPAPAPATRADSAPPVRPPPPAGPPESWMPGIRLAPVAAALPQEPLHLGEATRAEISTPRATAPGAVRRRLSEVRRTVSADLAVHWFADLGALLLFVGLFGFVAFAFADVQVGLRPVAEVAIPLAVFGVGAFLRRRGTPAVADVLLLLGGAMVPIVLIASFSDGATPPPDLSGGALAATLAVALGAVAIVLALVALRRPASPLRFLVAPMAWLGVAAAGLGLGRTVPTGSDLATPTAAQWSLVLVAIAVSASLAQHWRAHTLARAVLVACWPGMVVAFLVTATSAGNEGWPVLPVLLGAAATIVTVEVVARRWILPATLVQAAVAGGAAMAVADSWGSSRTAAAVMVLAIIAAESRARRGAPRTVPLGLTAAAAAAWVVTLGHLESTPWVALTTSSVVWVWAAIRHHRPALLPPAAWKLALWGALLPIAVATAAATSVAVAQVGVATMVVLVSAGTRARPSWADDVWAWWVPTVGGATWIWLVLTLPPERPPAHIAAALLVPAFLLSPRWPVVRLWTTAGAVALTIGGILWQVDATPAIAALVLSASGAALLLPAEIRRTRLGGHLGVIGLLTTSVAPAVAASAVQTASGRVSLAEVVVSSIATAGLIAVVVVEERRGASTADLLERLLRRSANALHVSAAGRAVLLARRVPLVVALPALAIVTAEWADRARWWDPTSFWLAVPPTVAMTMVVLCARLAEARYRPAARIASLEALALSCLLAAITTPATGPRAVALALVLAQALLTGPRLRLTPTTWIGWTAAGLLVPALAALTELPDDLAGVPLQVAGAAAALGALLLVRDRRRSGSVYGGSALSATLLAPVVTGSVAAALGLLIGLAGGRTIAGAACLLAAATALVAVLLLDAPWASIVPWILGVAALGLLLPVDLDRRPWTWVLLAAVEVIAATALAPDDQTTPWRRRWDLPPLVVAGGLAVLAMGLGPAAGALATTTTWCGMGGLALFVGVQRRWAAVGTLGAAAVVVGTGVAGPSWLAASLLGVSAASAVGVTRSTGTTRTALRWAAALAAAGSWASLLVRADAGAVPSSVATAMVGAVAVVGAALALRLALLDRAGAVNLAVPGIVGVGTASAWWLVEASLPDRSAWLLAFALAGTAVGVGAAAGPMGRPWFRDLGAVVGLAAGAFVAAATGPTIDQVVAVTTTAALVAGAGSLGLRRRERLSVWQRPLLLAGAGALAVALLSSTWASPGAGTFAMGATAVLAVAIAATSPPGIARISGQFVTAIAVPSTWGRALEWVDMPAARAVPATALVAGVAIAGLGAATRWRRPDPGWALTVLVPSGVAVVWAITALYASDHDGPLPGLGVALAVLLVAAAAAATARPLSQQWFRVASVAAAWCAVAIAADALGADRSQLVAAAASIALAATLAVVIMSVTARAASWIPPLEMTAVAGTGVAWLLVDPGRPSLLATGLLLTGAELAAFGIARRQPALLLASPWALCGAWLVVARSAIADGPVWITTPVGLTLLVTVSLGRRQRREQGSEPGSRLLTTLELVGVALMVVTPIVEAITADLAQIAVSLVIGAGVSGWGALTRVRHRLAAGAIVVAISLFVLLLMPMVDVTRRITGSGVWLALAAAGFLAILVAALLERSRRVARRALQRLRELTDDWE